MNEREKREFVEWPHLDSAENLNPLDPNKAKTLALYEKRRMSNMPPPTFREIGEYVGIDTTSHVSFILKSLIRSTYLTNWSEDRKIKSRNTTIRVDFSSVRLLDDEVADISKFPDMPGLTGPKK